MIDSQLPDPRLLPMIVGEGVDYEKDPRFEKRFKELQQAYRESRIQQNKCIHRLKRILLAQTMQPSQWQKVRCWFYMAQLYFAEGRYHAAFEALLLCEKELPSHETDALTHLHSLLATVALRQGHSSQALISAAALYTALQRLQSQSPDSPVPGSDLPPGITALLG